MFDAIKTLIESRASTQHYDPDLPVTEAQIAELVRLATRAPSAYNFQNWKFLAVRSTPARQRLQSLAFGQSQVGQAPVTFIVCGTLGAHSGLAAALAPSVEAGIVPADLSARWQQQAAASHSGNEDLQHDEAVRSASLAAMTLMLAAEGMGLSTCPMSGFDAQGVAQAFNLGPAELPVMLVTVGHATQGNWPQKPRRPVSAVLEMV